MNNSKPRNHEILGRFHPASDGLATQYGPGKEYVEVK